MGRFPPPSFEDSYLNQSKRLLTFMRLESNTMKGSNGILAATTLITFIVRILSI